MKAPELSDKKITYQPKQADDSTNKEVLKEKTYTIDFEFKEEEEFIREVQDLLTKLEVKTEKGKLRFYEILAIALGRDSHCKEYQITALKELAKYLNQYAQGGLKDLIEDLWIPIELEASPKYRKKLLKPGTYASWHVGNDKAKTYFTRTIRWSSPDQVKYWLSQVLQSDFNNADPSWWLSPQLCAFSLHLLAKNPKSKITQESIKDNLKNGKKNSSGGYGKVKELEQEVIRLRQENEKLRLQLNEKQQDYLQSKQEQAEVTETYIERASAWARFLTFLTLTNLKLKHTVESQEQKIAVILRHCFSVKTC